MVVLRGKETADFNLSFCAEVRNDLASLSLSLAAPQGPVNHHFSKLLYLCERDSGQGEFELLFYGLQPQCLN